VHTEEAFVVSPLDRRIEELENRCRPGPPWIDLLPSANSQQLNLQTLGETLDWSTMEDLFLLFSAKHGWKTLLLKDELLRIFASSNVAPVLAAFSADTMKIGFDDLSLDYALQTPGSKHTKEAEQLANCAKSLPDVEANRVSFKHEHRHTIMMCAKRVRWLAEGMKPYIMHYLNTDSFPNIKRFLYESCARISILAYCDLIKTQSGFFGVLLSP
jgi:hypothetical protein